MRKARLLLLAFGFGLGLGGCALAPSAEDALEAHEGAHGPPWAANEDPWVPPPVYAIDLPSPYYGLYGWDYAWYGPGRVGGRVFLRGGNFRHSGFAGHRSGHMHSGGRSGGRGGRR